MSELDQRAVASTAGVVVQAGGDATVTVGRAARRVAWPVRVGVPPVLANHYQERQAHGLLTEALASGRTAVVVGAVRGTGVVVSGLGGVGKSQLAARHAWSVWSDEGVDVAVWVSALSRDAVLTAYAQAAAQVLVDRDPPIANLSPEEVAETFRAWLAATSRRWLVVLDDVQDPADVRGLEPSVGAGGQVIMTSRLRGSALTRGAHRVIELGVFTEEEALDYFTGALGGHEGVGHAQLRTLAEQFGRLPLALGQAAAFIADQPLLTVADYQAMLTDRHRTLAELTPPEGSLPEHQMTVAATWSLSIERADRPDDPARPAGAGLARLLLEIASLLDPNGTPLAVFTSRPVLDHLTIRASREVRTDDVRDGLTRLHRLTLLTLDAAQQARTVAVHALVQRAVRDSIPADALHDLARTTADALCATWPEIDSTHIRWTRGLGSSTDLGVALRSCADTLRSHADSALWTPGPHVLLDRVGKSLNDTNQVGTALDHWRTLHQQAHTRLGPDHPDTLTARHNLTFWRCEAIDRQSGPEFRTSLADRLRVLGPRHPLTISHNRGFLWPSSSEASGPAGAVEEFTMLLADRLRISGPDHPHTLTARNNLARWQGEAGDPKRAVTELNALLPDYLRLLGPDHPETLSTRHNLAHWRGHAGHPARALEEFEVLLSDCTRILGPDHSHTLCIPDNIARWRPLGRT
ncbi:NB-ARC domain-containing protein [Saccharothrix sp.]|uniref:NB-ARC domain-containing protein n=1 Tax=Saccharothrix sp. TaxID=1873460 RepID=UPI002810D093|nr:NB-ARC domain-containing protein [Saccharothrix sp.]